MAVLCQGLYDSGAPGTYLMTEYVWTSSTRSLYLKFSRRCDGYGAWWNTQWWMQAGVTGIPNVSMILDCAIKPYTSGTIGTNWYSKDYTLTVPNDVDSVGVWFNSSPAGNASYAGTGTHYINVGYGYIEPGQTFVTISTNSTSGNTVNSGDQALKSNWQTDRPASESISYAGDRFNYTWDKNNPDQVGVRTNPASIARLLRDGDEIQRIWNPNDWDYSKDDKYQTLTRDATADDAGHYIRASMWKARLNTSGNYEYWQQWSGHYIQPQPTLDCNCTLRSTRFYSDTPSCVVWRLNKFNVTTNGYGTIGDYRNDGGITGGTSTKKIWLLTGSANTASNLHFGDAGFNANYSLPATPIDIHQQKITVNSSNNSGNMWWGYSWFNPRTGAADRLGVKNVEPGPVSYVSGSITLPTIDSIQAISGNGTTAVVENKKHIWTNQTNCVVTWRINHSGNSNGFGYDMRITENGGSQPSSKVTGGSMVPLTLTGWTGTYGGIDYTSDTCTCQHDGCNTNGTNTSITIIPYIKDSAGYKIFGEKTRSYVQSSVYTIYKIQAPGTPTFNTWSNTLPAIDGVKDVINYKFTSPNSFGNCGDFTKGYKLRYKIGNDTAKADGWQWKYINTPVTTNTAVSGTITQTYNRSSYTSCQASVAATSRYSTTWNAYLDWQSAYTSNKSFTIYAKDPYTATTGTLTTAAATTLSINPVYKFQCPQETVNANAFVQTTKISIDGGTAKTITSPTYTTSTPNASSGALTLKFNELSITSDTLARGAHTVVVTNEVASYFDSTTPVTNHVYFGTTTVKSNTLNIEVAELPDKPTINTPSPAYYYAGQERTLKWTFSPNDWGCLDTTHNARKYDYELYNPAGTKIQSGTIAKGVTQYTYTFTPTSPSYDGTYKFKLREHTVVGTSDWSESTMDIFTAIEPTDSVMTASNVLALASWAWTFKWVPGNNGSYKPVSANPITRMKMDVVSGASDNKLQNKLTSGTRGGITYTVNSDKSITLNGTATTIVDLYLFGAWKVKTKYQRHLKGNHVITLLPGNTNAGLHMVLVEDGTRVVADVQNSQVLDFTSHPDLTSVFIRINKNTTLSNVRVYPEIKEEGVTSSYRAYNEGTAVQSIMPWTNYANGTTISKNFTTNLNGYEDGTYRILVQYERYYTTKTIREIELIEVIPPEVELNDLSVITSISASSDDIPFKISLDVFAGTQISEAWYSMDYGKTWTSLSLSRTVGAHKYFEKNVTLTWLDEIYFKAHGKNPVDEKTIYWKHEMPTDYLTWLYTKSSKNYSRTKNLCDCGPTREGTIGGITYHYDESTGLWDLHGECAPTGGASHIYIPIKQKQNLVLKTGKSYTTTGYYLSGTLTKVGAGNGEVGLFLQDKNNSHAGTNVIFTSAQTEITHTTPTLDLTMNDNCVRIAKNTKLVHFKFKVQTEEGMASTSFEPFGVTSGKVRRMFMSHKGGTLKKQTHLKKL